VSFYRHAKTPLQKKMIIGVGFFGSTAGGIAMRLYLMGHAGYSAEGITS